MLDPEEFPQITGSLKNWKLGDGMEDAPHLLELQIHGTTVEVPVILDAFTKEEEGYLLTCHFPLSLKACNLKRPSVLGLIRVGDEVLVHVQTRIRPASE
jgi:hypothetical protein